MSRLYTIPLLVLIAALALVACSPAATDSPTATTASTLESNVDASPTPESASDTDPDSGDSSNTDTAVECDKLNLNVVTGDDLLATIPDFTQRMVREFQEYRPYVSIQEFRQEIAKYVDMDQVTAWEAYVYVPVSPNDSDAETLMQLPGVDDTLADALVANRPFADNEAFLITLGESVSPDQLTQAECYLAAEA